MLGEIAYGFVTESGRRVRERVGHGGAGERAVDEEGSRMGALDASLVLLVVEGEAVAESAGRGGEVLGLLVGVARSAARNPVGNPNGTSPVRLWMAFGPIRFPGVSDGTEGELRVPADAFACLGVSCGVSPGSSNHQGGGVPEDAVLGAAAVVKASRDFDRRQVLPVRVGFVPCGERGGVDPDVASPAAKEAPLMGEADSDQHQPVADLLQHPPTADLLVSCLLLPGRDHLPRLDRGQTAAPVAAMGTRAVVSRSNAR